LKRRFARLLLLVGAVAIGLSLSRQWPKDRLIHVVLGDAASEVVAVRLRYTGVGDREPDREVTFRYAPGHAPRIVSHEPRLATGDYDVDIEVGLTVTSETSEQNEQNEIHLRRRVHLEDSAVQIDVASALHVAKP
jgi:hypothetical protein